MKGKNEKEKLNDKSKDKNNKNDKSLINDKSKDKNTKNEVASSPNLKKNLKGSLKGNSFKI